MKLHLKKVLLPLPLGKRRKIKRIKKGIYSDETNVPSLYTLHLKVCSLGW